MTVTGQAIEFTPSGRGQPVPNLRLHVLEWGLDPASPGTPLPDVFTDIEGRYEIPNVSTYLFVRVAEGSNYKTLCDPHPLMPRYQLNLPVVQAAWANPSLPPGMWIPTGPTVWGVVSETTNGSFQRIGGATVTVDNGAEDPPVVTNAAGFYMICSLAGGDAVRTITAQKDGYETASRQFIGAWDTNVNLELVRR